MPAETDHQLLNALKHPLRRRILREMIASERISPRELSRALDEPLSNVSYHVRVLDTHQVVTLVDTQSVRGSTQHFYRTDIDEEWALAILKRGDALSEHDR